VKGVDRTGIEVIDGDECLRSLRGRLAEIGAGEAGAADVSPWAPGSRDHWMRLVPRRVTGRRVAPA
jgi:hypothetical protein